jgi:hypothetical protein
MTETGNDLTTTTQTAVADTGQQPLEATRTIGGVPAMLVLYGNTIVFFQ